MSKTGILLINLGTPDSPEIPDVRKYLREFLMDPLVIDIPALARWALVHLAILPRRPAVSSEAYKKIWTERGSPLLFHTADLAEGVRKAVGLAYPVRFAMRYQSPSIDQAVKELQAEGAVEIVALPLYPQYSLAATESTYIELRRVGESRGVPIRPLGDFFDDAGFIDAFAGIARAEMEGFRPDHVLFSYHGLPERQVRKVDSSGVHCFSSPDCCERNIESGFRASPKCYRAQCFQTTRLLAGRLGLDRAGYSIGFQSRLGRTPWIQPFTDQLYGELARKGVRRLAVICPSFVADCLETLEEIRIRGLEQFRAEGGEDLLLVSSLNSSPAWVETVTRLVTAHSMKH